VRCDTQDSVYTALYMASLRTQIYLTEEQRARLDALGKRAGKPLAALVRDAVDEYLDHTVPDAQAALAATFGVLPDLEVPSRAEWDRG
jgi:predicted DNA-binding protein